MAYLLLSQILMRFSFVFEMSKFANSTTRVDMSAREHVVAFSGVCCSVMKSSTSRPAETLSGMALKGLLLTGLCSRQAFPESQPAFSSSLLKCERQTNTPAITAIASSHIPADPEHPCASRRSGSGWAVA